MLESPDTALTRLTMIELSHVEAYMNTAADMVTVFASNMAARIA